MPTLETLGGRNLPTWTALHLDYSRRGDRPQVKHIRNRSRVDKTLYVGRNNGSPLGNPFRPIGGEAGRSAAIAKYRHWLWRKLQARNRDILDEFDKITADTVLLCHCSPKACHAEVISKAWKWLQAARADGRY